MRRFKKQVQVIDLLLPNEEQEIDDRELKSVKIGTREFKLPIEVVYSEGKHIFIIKKFFIKLLPLPFLSKYLYSTKENY